MSSSIPDQIRNKMVEIINNNDILETSEKEAIIKLIEEGGIGSDSQVRELLNQLSGVSE